MLPYHAKFIVLKFSLTFELSYEHDMNHELLHEFLTCGMCLP